MSMQWRGSRLLAAGGAAIAACVVGLSTAGTAFAAGPGGSESCPNGNLCLYYNSPEHGWGSYEHWSPARYDNLGNYQFKDWGNSSGYGAVVGGHAAAMVNNTDQDWIICSDTSFGNCQKFTPGSAGALPEFLHDADWAMEATG